MPVSYYDSVLVYARALHQMLYVDNVTLKVENHCCKQIPAVPWTQGAQVMEYLKQVYYNSLY